MIVAVEFISIHQRAVKILTLNSRSHLAERRKGAAPLDLCFPHYPEGGELINESKASNLVMRT
jgi:hypothetical protein